MTTAGARASNVPNDASAGLRRHQGQAATAVSQQAQDVGLDAEVVSDDVELGLVGLGKAFAQLPGAFGPFRAALDRDNLGQILAGHAGKTLSQFNGAFGVGANEDAGALSAFFTQDARQFACINACDTDDILRFQIVGQGLRRAEVGGQDRQILDDQAGSMNFV